MKSANRTSATLAEQGPREHLPGIGRATGHCCAGFVAAMHEAIFTTLVAAVAVLVPRRLVDELLEGAVVLIGDEIAGALPALGVIGRIAPGSTHQLTIAGKELGVDRRVADRILFCE